jgi:hypothetical protein
MDARTRSPTEHRAVLRLREMDCKIGSGNIGSTDRLRVLPLSCDVNSNTTVLVESHARRRQKIASGLTGELVAPLKRQGAMLTKKCQRPSSAQAGLISSSPAMQRSGIPI